MQHCQLSSSERSDFILVFGIYNNNLFHIYSAFIRGDMSKKFSNLKIKFVRGITPILKLLDANHNVVDELNIQKWDTDTIEEFLYERLA